MSRNVSGVYSLPAGSTVTNGDVSDASDLNTPLQDIAADLNIERPIVAGGTGANSAAAALVNFGLTATAAEINVLDGVTASTAELNILDGVTATAAELNILDGATLSVTELNFVDGVTSAIQTQLNAKQPLDADLTEIAALTRARGKLIVGGAAAWTDLALGTSGQVLTSDGTDVTWAAASSGATLFQTITTTAVATIESDTFNAGKNYIFEMVGVRHNSGSNRALQVELFGATDGAYSGVVRCSTSITATTGRGYGKARLFLPRTTAQEFEFESTIADSASAPGSNFVLNNASGSYERALVHFATAQEVTKARLSWVAGNFVAGDTIRIWEF